MSPSDAKPDTQAWTSHPWVSSRQDACLHGTLLPCGSIAIINLAAQGRSIVLIV